jgi:hypothetical protein
MPSQISKRNLGRSQLKLPAGVETFFLLKILKIKEFEFGHMPAMLTIHQKQ